MQFTIYDNATGQVLRWGDVPDEAVQLQVQEGEAWVGGHFKSDTHFWDGTAMQEIPASPGDGYAWNPIDKVWGPDVPALRATVHGRIEGERDRRLVAPVIQYDGMNLDADAAAIKNLSQKLAAVNSRIAAGRDPLPGSLVWKDHDNVIHEFPDLPSYKAWLDGYALALEDRNTMAWAWSWQKKTELENASTVQDILQISLA